MIVSNQIKCKLCGDTPHSAHRHDFKWCKCGAVAVDGGTDYLKRCGDLHLVEELSISMDKEIVDRCIEAVEWGQENNRNARGIAYAVLRALRDTGVLK